MDLRKLFVSLGLFALIPAIVIFDSLFYFMTKPACLNCGSLIDFLKNSSTTVAVLGSIGYKLRNKQ